MTREYAANEYVVKNNTSWMYQKQAWMLRGLITTELIKHLIQ
jgi:hypothetical protein